MATPIVAPVIASAVYAASGARVRHTPFLPERVLTALG
jgi:isoquinoline 1-oxidoreductase beta subunit